MIIRASQRYRAALKDVFGETVCRSAPASSVTNACEDRCVPTGRERQAEIFLGGAVGHRARVPFDFGALEQRARSSMTSEAFAYVAGAAGAEETMRANRRAFERIAIVPRMLLDVSARDTSVELFGRRLPAPVLLAPIGVLELAHRRRISAVGHERKAVPSQREVALVRLHRRVDHPSQSQSLSS